MNIMLIILFIFISLALIGYLLYFDIKTIIYISIIALFFPIHVRFMGRDALTTGTICILILYLKYFIDSFHLKSFIKEKYDLLIYFLIFAGALSVLLPILDGTIERHSIGFAIRGYFGFVSSLLLFLVLKNYQSDKYCHNREEYVEEIEKLFSLIIILIIIHIIISICVKFFPFIGSYFNIFITRNLESFDSVNRDGLQRIGSFVFSPESFGEILSVVSPIVLYKIIKYRKPFWLICLSFLLCGLFFTVTRSGILLFAMAFSVTFTYYFRKNLNSAIIALFTITISIFAIVFIYPQAFEAFILRFNLAKIAYDEGGTLLEILNRERFQDVIHNVFKSLKIFGNGITEFNFHNLYLTVLHRNGIIGAILYFLVLLYPLICLTKTLIIKDQIEDKKLVFACIVSFSAFLINELKFEFNRSESYQQLCWGLFALFYLSYKATKINKKPKMTGTVWVRGIK